MRMQHVMEQFRQKATRKLFAVRVQFLSLVDLDTAVCTANFWCSATGGDYIVLNPS